MSTVRRAPDENVTLAEAVPVEQLIKDCVKVTELKDLDEANQLIQPSLLIENADLIKELVDGGFLVVSPAEYVKVDDQVHHVGEQAWVIIKEEKGKDVRFVHVDFSQYLIERSNGVLEDHNFSDVLLSADELGIEAK